MINSNQFYDFCCQEHCWGFHKIPMFRRNYPKSGLMTLQANFSHRTTTWADCEQLPLTCFGNTSRFHVQTRTHLFIRVFQQLTLYQSIFWLFREKYEMSMGAKAVFHTNSARPDKMTGKRAWAIPQSVMSIRFAATLPRMFSELAGVQSSSWHEKPETR